MRRLTRSVVVALSLLLPALSFASARSPLPQISLVSQQFLSPDEPTKLADAFQGTLRLELEAPWNWPSFGLDVSMNRGAYYFGKAETLIWVSEHYPTDFLRPVFSQQGDQLTIAVSGISVLTNESFNIAARATDPPGNQFGSWSRFPTDLIPSVTIDKPLWLERALSEPPANCALSSWLEALFKETVVKLGTDARASIGISYTYSIGPENQPHWVTLPILLTPSLTYTDLLPAQLASAVAEWIEKNQPPQAAAYLNIQLTLYSSINGVMTPRATFNNLRLMRGQF